MFVAYLDP